MMFKPQRYSKFHVQDKRKNLNSLCLSDYSLLFRLEAKYCPRFFLTKPPDRKPMLSQYAQNLEPFPCSCPDCVVFLAFCCCICSNNRPPADTSALIVDLTAAAGAHSQSSSSVILPQSRTIVPSECQSRDHSTKADLPEPHSFSHAAEYTSAQGSKAPVLPST